MAGGGLGAHMQMSCGSAGSARGDAGGRSQDGPRPTREANVNINELMQMHANEARTGGGAGTWAAVTSIHEMLIYANEGGVGRGRPCPGPAPTGSDVTTASDVLGGDGEDGDAHTDVTPAQKPGGGDSP